MIYLVCHSGYLNFGDELLARTWIQFYREKFPDEEIVVDCCDARVAKMIYLDTERLTFVSTIWEISRYHNSHNIQFDLGNLQSWCEISYDLRIGLGLINKAKFIHMIGGGYICDEFWFNINLACILRRIKLEYNIRLIATGLSIVPLSPQNAASVIWGLECFDFVDFRDKLSYSIALNGVNRDRISLSCDDVFLRCPLRESFSGTGARRLFVSIQPEIDDKQRVINRLFALNIINSFKKATNGSVNLVEMDGRNDRSEVNFIASNTEHSVDIVRFAQIWESGLDIGGHDFVVASRFHAHLLGYAAGAHGIAIENNRTSKYYRYKHESLLRLGSKFEIVDPLLFDFRELKFEQDPPEDIGRAIGKLSALKYEIWERAIAGWSESLTQKPISGRDA